MRTLIISGKGSVVIPSEIRQLYSLKKGDRVHFIDYGEVISIVPASKTPLKDLKGMLKGKTSLCKALIKSRKQDTELGK